LTEADMACQLDMTPDMKRWIFEAHFYVAQINERVIAQFQDMKRDADRYAEAEYRRLSARYARENVGKDLPPTGPVSWVRTRRLL
jgi:hypothetical protein